MLSTKKFNDICVSRKIDVGHLANQIAGGGMDSKKAVSAIKNWQHGLLKPIPRRSDVQKLATALSVEATEISAWHSSYMHAPMSPSKARLVAALIAGRPVQDALDILKFTRKRAASMIEKVVKSAVADADEQQADVDRLYVSEARVDDAGVRIGTKRWRAKDRGRAHSITKKGCHIHITVTEL
ncbi:MAG: 50S ribosomal protein L22 [Phycisphaerae bacterium]|jgi:large subunit ribosomal protein L22